MLSIELTPSQRDILQILIDLYMDSETPIKSETIAELVDSNPWTIRNQMRSLTARQLVEGVPGPKGGYKPTATAFKSLEIQQMDEPASVVLQRYGQDVKSVIIKEINLVNLHHPKLHQAEIYIQGSISRFHEEDEVTVGPTPLMKLWIKGTVDGKNDTNNSLILRIENMIAPAECPVDNIE